MKRFRNILFVMESGPNDQVAFERAVSLATSNQARLTVIEVLEPLPPFLTGHPGRGMSNGNKRTTDQKLQIIIH